MKAHNAVNQIRERIFAFHKADGAAKNDLAGSPAIQLDLLRLEECLDQPAVIGSSTFGKNMSG